MATVLTASFPWGMYHATPWDAHVNEGQVEWPPSSWRLCRAVLNAWHLRCPDIDEATIDRILTVLCQTPSIRLDPHTVGAIRSYLPDEDHQRGQEAPRQTLIVDSFVALARHEGFAMRWDPDLSDDDRAALARLLGHVAYLGRAESVCDLRLSEHDGAEDGWIQASPDGKGGVRSAVPLPSATRSELEVSVGGMRSQRRLVPEGMRWIHYERPTPLARTPRRRAPRSPVPSTALLAFTGPALPSITAEVLMADVLRSAAMSIDGRRNGGDVSWKLSGKASLDGDPLHHRHAHWFVVDDDGDGFLDTAVVHCCGGLEEREIDALDRITDLHLAVLEGAKDFRPVRVSLLATGSLATLRPELVGPATTWMSATPFAPARHFKRRPGLGPDEAFAAYVIEEAQREAGRVSEQLPADIDVSVLDPTSAGYRFPPTAFRRHRRRQHLADARRAAFVRFELPQAHDGPFFLGALSHYGLGRFVKV